MKRILLVLILLGAMFAPAQSRAGTGPPACTTVASGSVTNQGTVGKGLTKYGVSARATAICNYNIEAIYIQVSWVPLVTGGTGTPTYGAGGGGNENKCFNCSLWWVNSYGRFVSEGGYHGCITVTARAYFLGGQGDEQDKSIVCSS